MTKIMSENAILPWKQKGNGYPLQCPYCETVRPYQILDNPDVLEYYTGDFCRNCGKRVLEVSGLNKQDEDAAGKAAEKEGIAYIAIFSVEGIAGISVRAENDKDAERIAKKRIKNRKFGDLQHIETKYVTLCYSDEQ